jgi:hypothetical protein
VGHSSELTGGLSEADEATRLMSARGFRVELDYLLPGGSGEVGPRVVDWFTVAVERLAGEFVAELPAAGLSSKVLRDPAGGPFGLEGSRWCSLLVIGQRERRLSKSLRAWSPKNWQWSLAQAADVSVEMSAKFSTLNGFGHAGTPSLTISAYRLRPPEGRQWLRLDATYVVGRLGETPPIPDEVPEAWREFLLAQAERLPPPVFGFLADDAIEAGTRTPLEARRTTFPVDTLPLADSQVRGYSWVTVTSAGVLQRLGGVEAGTKTGVDKGDSQSYVSDAAGNTSSQVVGATSSTMRCDRNRLVKTVSVIGGVSMTLNHRYDVFGRDRGAAARQRSLQSRQAIEPGGQMSRPFGWRRDAGTGELTWQPINVCVLCQPKYPLPCFRQVQRAMQGEHGAIEEAKMTVADVVIGAVEWSRYHLLDGPALRFGRQLAEFVAEGPVGGRRDLWETMENHVFAQDDIYSAAEPTISVLLASLIDERPQHVRIAILDLLFHLVQAASYRDDDLGKRCLEKAAAGGWLLVREAIAGPAVVMEACLGVLDIASPECAQFVRSSS